MVGTDDGRRDSIVSRRQFLAATSAAVGGLAGCSGDQGGGTPTLTPTPTDAPTPTDTPSPTAAVSARACDSPTVLSQSDVADGGTLSAGCYRAEGTLAVESGTLTLEAGVQVAFASDAGLAVGADGGLHAAGAADDPVILTGTEASRGHWKGLFFRGSRSSDNRLERTLVQHAGGGSWNPNWRNGAIHVQGGSSLSLDGAVVRENGRAGLGVRGGANRLSVSNSRFEANEFPARVHANVAGALTPDNSFAGNDTDAVRLGVDGADTVSDEQTWQHPGVPFHVNRTVGLEAPLAIEAGATFVFDQTKGLNVREGGRLAVRGTSDAPVTFTGREELPGSWKGIRFRTSRGVENVLEHAVVEFAGDSAWNPNHRPAGLFLRGNQVSVAVENATFRENAGVGLVATGRDAGLTLTATEFDGNEVPLLLQANLVDGLSADTAFERNGESYVELGAPGVGGAWTDVVDPATWPALEVPYRPTVNVGVEAPLEISPGATLAFEQGRGMRIRGDGRLAADASDGDPITFRGVEDIAGFWKGLYFVDSLSSDNVLHNAVVENGGNSEWVGGPAPDVANLLLAGGSDAAAVDLADSTIRGSGRFGLAIGDGSARVSPCSGMRFEDNAGADTYNLETSGPISGCQ